jgi:hypothetical protein
MKNYLRQITTSLGIFFVVGSFFAFNPSIQQAEAACRTIVNPPAAGLYYHPTLEAYATGDYFVPGSSSTCNDINIRDISLPNGNPTCAFFGVWFFPSNGPDYVNRWTHICTATSHVDIPIATNVKTGTKYRVVVTSENGHPTSYYNYTLKD